MLFLTFFDCYLTSVNIWTHIMHICLTGFLDTEIASTVDIKNRGKILTRLIMAGTYCTCACTPLVIVVIGWNISQTQVTVGLETLLWRSTAQCTDNCVMGMLFVTSNGSFGKGTWGTLASSEKSFVPKSSRSEFESYSNLCLWDIYLGRHLPP